MQVRTTVDVEVAPAEIIDGLANEIYSINVGNGFWDDDQENPYNIPLKLALIHDEASEALKVHREEYPCDCDKAQGIKYLTCTCSRNEEMTEKQAEDFGYELADIIIRTLDLAHGYHIPIGELVVNKVEKNKNRPFKHGKRY